MTAASKASRFLASLGLSLTIVLTCSSLALGMTQPGRALSQGEHEHRDAGLLVKTNPALDLEQERKVWIYADYWICQFKINPDGSVDPICGFVYSHWQTVPDVIPCRLSALDASHPITVCGLGAAVRPAVRSADGP